MRCLLSVGLLAAALVANAGTFVFTAPKTATVRVLNDKCKEFLALPVEKIDPLLLDKEYFKEFKKSGSHPCKVRFAWEYSPDKDEGKPKRFIVTVRRADDGTVVFKGETPKGEIELDNFEIATDYVFRASVVNGREVELFGADHPFKTEDLPPRVVRVEGVNNFRDLGGWLGEGGKRVKQGLVYRSQGLNNNADWFAKRNPDGSKIPKPDKNTWSVGKLRGTCESRRECRATFGFKTELDLRGVDTETWGMFASPLGSSVDWRLVQSSAYGGMRHREYRVAFARDFRTFLNRDNYPIVFHCIGGADRTGILAYILNGLLGVSEADLDRDYHFTAACMSYPWPKPSAEKRCRLDGFKRVLDKYKGTNINERIYKYVLDCGIKADEIARFKAIMFGEDAQIERDAYTTFFNAPSARRRELMRSDEFRKKLHACRNKWAGEATGVPRWYSEAANMRDLGGWRTQDGSRIRFGRIFRSAKLDKPEVRSAIVKRLGIKTSIDLRKAEEARPTPDLPVVTVVANAYAGTVKNPKWLREAFDVMLDESKYPIIFHCAAGADRTGTLAVAIELLLGVDEDDVAKDWQLTAINNINPRFESIRYDRLMGAISKLEGDTWQQKAESWVRSAGVTDAEIAKFRAMMLEKPKLVFGLVSDTHICAPYTIERKKGVRNSDEVFRYAMRWMASEGVDAVVNAGDVTEAGTLEEAKIYQSLFEKEFEKGLCRDLRRPVTHFSVWGNHDAHSASYMTVEPYWQVSNECELVRGNYEGLSPFFAGVPFNAEGITRQINGVWFGGANWEMPKDGAGIIERIATAAGPSNVCFWVKHHPKFTAAEEKALARHPNCVAIVGHKHLSFDSTNAFTIVNGSARMIGASTSSCKGGSAQAAIVRVWPDGLAIDKRDVKTGDRLMPQTELKFTGGKFSLGR